jgi:hypothetical protein
LRTKGDIITEVQHVWRCVEVRVEVWIWKGSMGLMLSAAGWL